MSSKPLVQETIKNFSYLYSVVVALSLTTAVRNVISTSQGVKSPFNLTLFDVITFSTFLAVTIPFYHGALMFLVRNYRRGFKTKKKGELLIDFVALLAEAIVILALAESMLDLVNFIGWLFPLMIVDLIWVIFVYFKSKTRESDAPLSWAGLDLAMIIFLYLIGNFAVAYTETCFIVLLMASLVRSILDYKLNYEYYFPTDIK